MTKKLNEAAIFNELKGQSAFFRGATPPPDEPLNPVTEKEVAPAPENLPISDPVLPVEPPQPARSASSPFYPASPEPVRPYGSTSGRTDERTSGRRTITRYAFEFFRDQIETLKQLSLEEKMRGEKGSMSEMIREAVDMYITKRRNRDGI
jgi:hypothetical protein